MEVKNDEETGSPWRSRIRLIIIGVVAFAVGWGLTVWADDANAASPNPEEFREYIEIDGERVRLNDNSMSLIHTSGPSPRVIERRANAIQDALVSGKADVKVVTGDGAFMGMAPVMAMAPPPRCLRSPKPAFCYKPHTLRTKFKRDKIGNSKGFKLPPKIRRKANRKWSRRVGPERAAKVQWWDRAFDNAICTTSTDFGVSQLLCRKNRHLNARKRWRAVRDIHIDCAGRAILTATGAAAAGEKAKRLKAGWIGAGLGGAGCYWGHLMK